MRPWRSQECCRFAGGAQNLEGKQRSFRSTSANKIVCASDRDRQGDPYPSWYGCQTRRGLAGEKSGYLDRIAIELLCVSL
jgi:hypothetical protein